MPDTPASRPLLLIAAEEDGTVLGAWRMPAHTPGGLVQQVSEIITAREVSPESVGLIPLDPAAWFLISSSHAPARPTGYVPVTFHQPEPGPVPAPYCATHQRAHWDDNNPACRWPAPEVCDLCGGKIRSGCCRDCGEPTADPPAAAGAWQRAPELAAASDDLTAAEVPADRIDEIEERIAGLVASHAAGDPPDYSQIPGYGPAGSATQIIDLDEGGDQ